MIYLRLYIEFFKIGLFAVGGGLATLPFIGQLAEKYGWITQRQILDMIAISESTPGPIGINAATFVGNMTGGLLGGIIATIGVITPSVIVILIIAHYFARFSEKPAVKFAFIGIRPAVTGLIAAVGFEVARVALFDMDNYTNIYEILSILNLKAIVLFALIMLLINKYKKHPITYLVGAAIIGIIFRF